jgi:hypothetical protein
MKLSLASLALALAVGTASAQQVTTTTYTVTALSTCVTGSTVLNCTSVPVNPTAPFELHEAGTLTVEINGVTVVVPPNPNNPSYSGQPAPAAVPGTFRKSFYSIPRSFYTNTTYWIDGAGGVDGIFTTSTRAPRCGSYLHSYVSQACAKVDLTGGTFTVQQ